MPGSFTPLSHPGCSQGTLKTLCFISVKSDQAPSGQPDGRCHCLRMLLLETPLELSRSQVLEPKVEDCEQMCKLRVKQRKKLSCSYPLLARDISRALKNWGLDQ